MSKNNNQLTWKAAFLNSPGPNSGKEALFLFLKGLGMGAADIIPGVSGGTIAFITGIYQALLLAIQSFDLEVIKRIVRFEWKSALSLVHFRFLLFLVSGIGISILSLARLMNFLLKYHPVPTWALFFGLISASILFVGKNIQRWIGTGGVFFLIGALIGFFVVGLIPVQTPEALWFIFLSGMIAICAMILPGLSGAFLLLILGKYEFVTGALKDPFHLPNLTIIIVFCIGCLIGIVGFSRFLSLMLKKFYNPTIALLTGLMLGAMRKVWPWKEVLETKMIRGKEHILRDQNVFPQHWDESVTIAIALALVGFIVVVLIEKMSGNIEE